MKMDTVAVNKESRIFVPVRFVAEALGAWVGFNVAQIYQTLSHKTAKSTKSLKSLYGLTL